MTLGSDSHRYARVRPLDRRRTCQEIVVGVAVAVVTAAVAAGVADGADSVVAFTVAVVVAAAALPGSVRANIAVQRYILDAACEFGISIGCRQKTHGFFFSSSLKSCDSLCDPARNNRFLTG